ncbi:MAG TPA: pilus assembly protein TadG-related protein [Candidatus Limnocylindria bacterium]|nr:pilus assembly protein TadG-related protein [Candidatus Limnocylindria bacterium]
MPTIRTQSITDEAQPRMTSRGNRPRGQVLVLFALLLTFLLGTAAFVVDLAWIWVNELKVQRAADAAALAGVVFLPGNPVSAGTSAHEESRKNGYLDGDGTITAAPNGGVDVWARPDSLDPRRMLVTVSAPIETFFMKIFGFDQLQVTRDAKAEFILPVPMGSPENYYGVFGALRTPDGGVWQPNASTTLGPLTPRNVLSSSTAAPGTNQNNNADSCNTNAAASWGIFPTTGAAPQQDDRVNSSNNQWMRSPRINDRVCLNDFGFTFPANPATPPGAPAYPGHVVDGIEVRLETFASDTSGCELRVDLMWGAAGSGGTNNTNTTGTGDKILAVQGTEATGAPYTVLGGASDTWTRAWPLSDITANTFRVRVWNTDPAACSTLTAGQPAAGIRTPNSPPATAPSAPVAGEVYVDLVQVVIHYHTYTWIPDPQVRSPYNQALNARGLWGTFINQGAEKVNGDAYLPKWDPRTSGTNAEYNPNQYYNYAIEMPAGATAGEVWIFDPAMCATDTGGQFGTGDRFFGGSTAATSAYYTLWNTFNTPFDLGDDTLANPVSRAHNIFANQQADDDTLFGSGSGPVGTSCTQGATAALNDGRFWHNRWYPMQPYVTGAAAEETPASAEQPWPLLGGGPTSAPTLNMTGGNTYRLHTRTTNPTNPTAMDNANGHNSFSIWTQAWCGGSVCAAAPRVYGLGAMEAFTPLPGGGAAQFYLAEIEPIHAGKSLEIRLWDPGDTGSLSADLRIKYPSGGSYHNADMDFIANAVASGAAACNGRSDDTVGPPGPLDDVITTNTGGSSQYNGCWLTIVVVIPDTYDGDPCPGVPPCLDQDWWKIEYTMGGAATDNAFDLTTWQVTLRGNPVHLVVP